MTRSSFLIVAVFLVGCSGNTSRHPWQSAETGLDGVVSIPPPSQSSFKMFLGARKPLSHPPVVNSLAVDRSDCKVTVKNIGSTPLIYFASGGGHVELVQEVYQSGEWQLESWDSCGTGKKEYELKPDQSVVLTVGFWDTRKRERMLAHFSEKGTLNSGLVVLAAEPKGVK